MKLEDLKNGNMWVIGTKGFDTVLFVRALTPNERPYSRFPWRWASLLRAKAFASREDAERLLDNVRFGAFLDETTSRIERRWVRALKVELSVKT